MIGIAINVSSHQEYFEVDISGNNIDFTSFVKQLLNTLSKNQTGVITLKIEPNTYFPKPIRYLSTALLEDLDGLITVQIIDDKFKLSGDALAFQKLINFLESVPNLSPGEHFHLDQFDHEDLLAPITSNMSFIFSMKS
jgi:hypothetical protein